MVLTGRLNLPSRKLVMPNHKIIMNIRNDAEKTDTQGTLTDGSAKLAAVSFLSDWDCIKRALTRCSRSREC